MARKARIDLPSYFYHVIARGQRKNPLFFSNSDKEQFLSIVKELLQIYDILIYAFAILRNHFHLLVYRGETSLSQFLKQLDTRYAIYFNKKYGTVGHVFQDRPKSFIILDNKYLIILLKYIHRNPEKAGIVMDPNDYFFSSALCYNSNTNCDIVTKFKIFSGEQGMVKYKEFMKGKGNDELIIYQDAIGTEEMYKKLDKRTSNRQESYKGQRRNNDEIKKMEEYITQSYGSLKITNIQNNVENAKIRKDLILKLYQKGFRQSNIAKVFGISKSGINNIIRRSRNNK